MLVCDTIGSWLLLSKNFSSPTLCCDSRQREADVAIFAISER